MNYKFAIFISLFPLYALFFGLLSNVCIVKTSSDYIVCPNPDIFLNRTEFLPDHSSLKNPRCYYYVYSEHWNAKNEMVKQRHIQYIAAKKQEQIHRTFVPQDFVVTLLLYYAVPFFYLTFYIFYLLLQDLNCGNGHGDAVAMMIWTIPMLIYGILGVIYEFSKIFYPLCRY